MSKNIEFEKRVMLSIEQYQALYEYAQTLANKESMVLVNHYFDDEDLSLRKAHKMLRIRNINNDEYELTLKVKGDNGDLEINHPLSNKEVNELLHSFKCPNTEINNYLKETTSKEIKYITTLKTERIEAHIDNYLFVLDKNHYSDIVDYDLEIEANDIEVAEQMIKKYCSTFGMQYDEHYKSKSRRAINKALNL